MANPNTAWRYRSVWALVEAVEAHDYTGDEAKTALRAKYPDAQRYRIRPFRRAMCGQRGAVRRTRLFVGVYEVPA